MTATPGLFLIAILAFFAAAVVRAVARSVDGTLVALGLRATAWAFYQGIP